MLNKTGFSSALKHVLVGKLWNIQIRTFALRIAAEKSFTLQKFAIVNAPPAKMQKGNFDAAPYLDYILLSFVFAL